MAAAYAVALQMLLSVAIASQAAAAAPGEAPTCYGLSTSQDGTGKADGKVHHASCILCMTGLSAPVDQPALTVAPVEFGNGVVLERRVLTPALAQAPPSPRLSQGPPTRM